MYGKEYMEAIAYREAIAAAMMAIDDALCKLDDLQRDRAKRELAGKLMPPTDISAALMADRQQAFNAQRNALGPTPEQGPFGNLTGPFGWRI